MIRRLAPWFGLVCALALLLGCYRSVLFADGQFGYRDAAHYYYPLYQKVQSEWAAGRIPLWDPSENAGMPLLGNPTAAVLYPGKLIFALFSYPWAVRLYAVAHSALAFAGAWVLLRGWRASTTGATLAGLSYAFGAPVLFQYCNIIFLVGAAWIPWGCWAVDRWLRLGRASGVLVLAAVLAMQVLGGDPESAYLIGLCSAGYALLLVRDRRDEAAVTRRRGWTAAHVALWSVLILAGLVAWFGLTVALGVVLPGFRPLPGEGPWGPVGRWLATGRMPRFRLDLYEGPIPGVGWTSALSKVVAAAWGLAGLILVTRWWRRQPRPGVRGRVRGEAELVPRLAGLAGAAALAGALAAAQLLPVAEYTGISARATDEGPHDIYPFSIEPHRLVELVWPGAFGRTFGGSGGWAGAILPETHHRPWSPSLYLGGLTVFLALVSLGKSGQDGRRPPYLAWLVGIVAVGTVASLGEFASPVWLARYSPAMAALLGPHDPPNANAVRLDGFLRDGDGSPYSLMALALPGFHSFRFPSKLFTFVSLAMAALAGLGWDRVVAGEGRRTKRLAIVGASVSLAACLTVLLLRPTLIAWFEGRKVISPFGLFDPRGAVTDLILATGQGALICLATVALLAWARRWPALAGAAAVGLMTLDLGAANESFVRAVPQADFEVMPRTLARIAEAERANPAAGPYRIHRMPIWNPSAWQEAIPTDRIRDFLRWELATIQPKYGLLHGVEYTQTLGVAELYDYEWFFSPFPRSVIPEAARTLGINTGDSVVVYPRRGYDLWNSRYFILPYVPRWDSAERGIAAFLPDTTRIDPPPGLFQGPAGRAAEERWARQEDYQVVRNENAYPRAWVVHDIRFKPTVTGLGRRERKETMEEILFPNDLFWRNPMLTSFDPRRVAWIETDNPADLAGTVSRANPSPREAVTVAEYEPDRVVLDADLETPGLVILADVYYPGWTLTIDDRPAPIHRANRLMRAAAVSAGRHRLVYTYQPASFRVGAAISLAGLVVLAGASVWVARPRRSEPVPA